MINKKSVFSANYAGTQTTSCTEPGRGIATNTFSPDYSEEYSGRLTLAGGTYAGANPPYPGWTVPAQPSPHR